MSSDDFSNRSPELTRADVATYVGEMLEELQKLADGMGDEMLKYLLSVAGEHVATASSGKMAHRAFPRQEA